MLESFLDQFCSRLCGLESLTSCDVKRHNRIATFFTIFDSCCFLFITTFDYPFICILSLVNLLPNMQFIHLAIVRPILCIMLIVILRASELVSIKSARHLLYLLTYFRYRINSCSKSLADLLSLVQSILIYSINEINAWMNWIDGLSIVSMIRSICIWTLSIDWLDLFRSHGYPVGGSWWFVYCVAIADGAALYRAFLLREFSNENLEFWVAVEEYKLLKPQKMATKAQKVYNDFIAVQAPKEVNILPGKVSVSVSISISSWLQWSETIQLHLGNNNDWIFNESLLLVCVWSGEFGLGDADDNTEERAVKQKRSSRIRPGAAAHPEHDGTWFLPAIPAIRTRHGTDPSRTLLGRKRRSGRVDPSMGSKRRIKRKLIIYLVSRQKSYTVINVFLPIISTWRTDMKKRR